MKKVCILKGPLWLLCEDWIIGRNGGFEETD